MKKRDKIPVKKYIQMHHKLIDAVKCIIQYNEKDILPLLKESLKNLIKEEEVNFKTI